MIEQAVTGKIDVRTGKPYPAYKPSGVDWLGNIPEHWDVRRLKHLASRIVGGATPDSGEPRYWNGEVVWITPTDVSDAVSLRRSRRHLTEDGLAACSAEVVPAGSIVVTSRAPVGNVALAKVPLCTNQGCKAIVLDDAVTLPTYGFHLLTTLKDELESRASGTTFTEISTQQLAGVPLPVPPLGEQREVVRFVDDRVRRLDAAIARAERQIELLEEYRTRLTSDVVTGKLDVREVAARLPDEDDENVSDTPGAAVRVREGRALTS